MKNWYMLVIIRNSLGLQKGDDSSDHSLVFAGGDVWGVRRDSRKCLALPAQPNCASSGAISRIFRLCATFS